MTRGTFGSIKLWVVSAATLTTNANATVFGNPWPPSAWTDPAMPGGMPRGMTGVTPECRTIEGRQVDSRLSLRAKRADHRLHPVADPLRRYCGY